MKEKEHIVEQLKNCRPSRSETEEAVRTLIRWVGENPYREGLLDTPSRVVKSFSEMFAGYSQDPKSVLGKTFADEDNYGEIILLKDIEFESCCEHHILPIIGVAHVAYIAKDRLVGLSKLARLVDIYARRMQTQEGMTAQILAAMESVMEPQGAAVIIEAKHYCMSMRGVCKSNSVTTTEKVSGCFAKTDIKNRLYQMIAR